MNAENAAKTFVHYIQLLADRSGGLDAGCRSELYDAMSAFADVDSVHCAVIELIDLVDQMDCRCSLRDKMSGHQSECD